ncbi:unnamed protein product [Pleuronectes platessa]|uniref:Uncharacterized protein n=1 Tax=Pleuronectes platessa TaxID=8262 RepID=A0A9N7U8L8_PLEPL|nr:unnamed protein product [Pleuronectes platessa]
METQLEIANTLISIDQRHDRLRNHKDPISQEGITISPGDRQANRVGFPAAKAYGPVAQVGGTWLRGGGYVVTWMKSDSQLSRGGFHNGPQASNPYFEIGP